MQCCTRRISSHFPRIATFPTQLCRRRQRHFAIQSLSIRMASTLPRLPIFEALAGHDPRSTVAVHSTSGRKFTYGELMRDVVEGKERLLKEGGGDIDGERIAFLVENSYDYVGAQNYLFPQFVGPHLTKSSDFSFYSWHPCDSLASFSCISGTRIAIYHGS